MSCRSHLNIPLSSPLEGPKALRTAGHENSPFSANNSQINKWTWLPGIPTSISLSHAWCSFSWPEPSFSLPLSEPFQNLPSHNLCKLIVKSSGWHEHSTTSRLNMKHRKTSTTCPLSGRRRISGPPDIMFVNKNCSWQITDDSQMLFGEHGLRERKICHALCPSWFDGNDLCSNRRTADACLTYCLRWQG